MSYYIDWKRFSTMVKLQKARMGTSYYELEQVYNLSNSTITRVLQGGDCRIPGFLKFCDWLQVHPTIFIKHTKFELEEVPVKSFVQMVREDNRLDPIVADALATLLEAVYPPD